MAGILVDWPALELAFENHAPQQRTYLDRTTGDLFTFFEGDNSDASERVKQRPAEHVRVEPIPSREQYRMMELFIDSVTHEPLKEQLKDSIVGKGAFRRFKDVVGRFPEERKRWFAFRDVLLHRFIIDWLKAARLELTTLPDWSLELPEPGEVDETALASVPVGLPVEGDRQESDDVRDYLLSWARAHGTEYNYLFGPAAFERLAQDMAQEFTLHRRR
ncbi:MAG: UPF0158 family protein [Myxococcota bacterium]